MIMITFVTEKFTDLMRVSKVLIVCMSPYLSVSLYSVMQLFSGVEADYRSVYISYGGMLMNLEGPYRKLSKLAHDNVYLLIRK